MGSVSEAVRMENTTEETDIHEIVMKFRGYGFIRSAWNQELGKLQMSYIALNTSYISSELIISSTLWDEFNY